MKVREVMELLEADGWYHVTTKGDHRQYKPFSKTRSCDYRWTFRRWSAS